MQSQPVSVAHFLANRQLPSVATTAGTIGISLQTLRRLRSRRTPPPGLRTDRVREISSVIKTICSDIDQLVKILEVGDVGVIYMEVHAEVA